jgi:hypothetical protein
MLAVVTIWLAPASGSAQTAWRVSHTAGQPILVLSTPPLTGGQTYWFEIGGPNIGNDLSAPGDSVATLRTSTGSAGTNIAGADGCNTTTPNPSRSWLRGSCFSATIPSSYTTPTSFWLIVRSYSNSSAATASVRVQRGTTFVDLACSGSTIQTGCWTTLGSNLSFGAATAPIGTSATNYHFETRERPGTPMGPPGGLPLPYQMIAFAPSAASWDIRVGAVSNHPNLVGTTAEFVGPLPSGITSSGIAFAGYFGGSSPVDFVRNDRGRLPGGTTFGFDADTDGLGPALETVLQTCDSTNLAYCSTLPGCSAPLNTLRCIASRRDSDQDGFEDALEFYGYQNGIDNLSNMARFGANPAQYDVFLELDSADATDSQDSTPCTYGDDNYMDRYEAAQLAATFSASSATSGGFVNPNGTRGISTHVDIPPLPTSSVNPAPALDNPVVGIWGGASCVSTPSCTSDAGCMFGGTPGVCDDLRGSNTNRYCIKLNTTAAYQTDQRRWLFRHGNLADSTPGFNGAAQGGQQAGPYDFFSGGCAAATHELGHLGSLPHGGPAQNSYSIERNWSPLLFSTMNYRHSYIGFWEITTNGSMPSAATQTLFAGYLDAAALTSRSSSVDPTAVPETCVPYFSQLDQTAIAATAAPTTLNYYSEFVAGCVNVDWDRDGSIRPSGALTTMHEPWRASDPGSFAMARRQRGTNGAVAYRRLNHPAEIVVTNGVRRLIRNELFEGTNPAAPSPPIATTQGRLTVSTASTFTCAVTPAAAPADRYLPCDFAGTTPTFIQEGASGPIQTRNFAACDIAQPPGLTGDTALIVWQVPGTSTLRWGRLGPSAGDVLEDLGSIASATPRTVTDDTSLLSLGRTSTGAVLVYRNPAGALVEQVLTWSGTIASWSAPATLSSSIWTGMNASAGLTHVYGSTDFTAGAYMAVQVGTTLSIYRRTGAAAWSVAGTVATPAAVLLGQPVIEIGYPWPHATIARRRINLFARFANGWPVQVRDSDLSAATFGAGLSRMPGWINFDDGGRTMATTTVAVDNQTAPHGLRGADYDMVPDALVLGFGTSACPAGSSVVNVGSRPVCFSAGVPIYPVNGGTAVGVIDCGPSTGTQAVAYATDGACPASYVCTAAVQGRSFCSLKGFVPMIEQRAPFADGMIQMRIEQQNEWPQLRHGFCRTGRELRSQSFTPTAYRYPQSGLPGVGSVDVCATAPTY